MWSSARPNAPTPVHSPSGYTLRCDFPLEGYPRLLSLASRSASHQLSLFPTRLRVAHASHQLSAAEVPLRGEDAEALAATAQAVATPSTEVRHRSRDVALLDYRPSCAGRASCTAFSIDRHWLTLRQATLTAVPSDRDADMMESLSVCFYATTRGSRSRTRERARASPPLTPLELEARQWSRHKRVRSAAYPGVTTDSEPLDGDGRTPKHDGDHEESVDDSRRVFPVYSTRWRHEDALLLTDEEDLVRVLRCREDSQRALVLSRSRLFSVAVSDGQRDCAHRSGPLRLLSTCTLTDDITVNALCAAHWGPYGTLVGCSDGSLKLVDWRVPPSSAMVLDTTVPQPTVGGRRPLACVLSCCALSEHGGFRVACGLGAVNGEVAVADLRRVAFSEATLRSRRRVQSRAVRVQRALAAGALSSPTGSPIADIQLIPDPAATASGPSLCLGMVDVCGSVSVMSVADLEYPRGVWSGRRSRAAPTRSRVIEADDDGDAWTHGEPQGDDELRTPGVRREVASPALASQRVLAATSVRPSPHARVDVTVIDEEQDGDDMEEEVQTADARRRTVSFSATSGHRAVGGRLPSPEAVATAWPWRPPPHLVSRSPSFAVSSPTLTAYNNSSSGGVRHVDGRAPPNAPGRAVSSAAPRGTTRSLSTVLTTPSRPLVAAADGGRMATSPPPSLGGVLSSTDLRCAVVCDPSWTQALGRSLLISTQPASATTSWYDVRAQKVLGELVPLVGGTETLMASAQRQGQYVVGLSVLGPLVCVETAGGGTYCVLPESE